MSRARREQLHTFGRDNSLKPRCIKLSQYEVAVAFRSVARNNFVQITHGYSRFPSHDFPATQNLPLIELKLTNGSKAEGLHSSMRLRLPRPASFYAPVPQKDGSGATLYKLSYRDSEVFVKKKEEVPQTYAAANRRTFLRGAGLTGMGLAGAALVGGRLAGALPGAKTFNVEAAAISDMDLLNFALNIEYLQAEFYTMIVTGKRLEQTGFPLNGKGTYGPTTGGHMINFGSAGQYHSQLGRTANGLMGDEQRHAKFFRSQLGSNAIAKPAINLDALGKVDTYLKFIVGARKFEQTCESFLTGTAALIQSKAILTAAAQILGDEAEHVGNLRLFCDLYNVPTMKIDSKDVLPPPSGNNEFTINGNGLAPTRTISEVLGILYGSNKPGTSRGGFFPQGLNGAINVV